MKKAICLVVVLSVLLGTASCSKEASDPSVSNPVIGPDNQGYVSKNDFPDVVNADSPWYDAKTTAVEGVGSVTNYFADPDSDTFILECLNDDTYLEEYFVCGTDGDKRMTLELSELANGDDWCIVYDAFFKDGSWHLIAECQNSYWIYDLGDNGITNKQTLSFSFLKGQYYICELRHIDGGFVMFSVNTENGHSTLVASLLDDNYQLVSSVDTVNADNFPGIAYVIQCGEKQFEFFVYEDKERVVDFETMTCYEPENKEWCKGVEDYCFVGGEVYAKCYNGVARVDYENQQLVSVFDYNSCFVNRNTLSTAYLLSADPQKIVFGSEKSDMTMFGSLGSSFEITTLTKAETNPNVGKTILTAASVKTGRQIPYFVSEAVMNFNMTSEDCIIMLVEDYGLDRYSDSEITNLYASVNASSSMSDRMAFDLLNGDGPDIIIGGYDIAMLHNEDYLIDLSALSEEILRENEGVFFANVFDACKENGVVYGIPLSFTLDAIVTNKCSKSNGQGFTFAEYKDFVSGPLNGEDPLLEDNYGDKLSCFSALFSCMDDEFIRDGKIDLDNEAFRQLCVYVKDLPTYYPNEGGPVGTGCFFYGIEKYIMLRDSLNGLGVYGYPSYDGRGPSVRINDSLSVTTNCKDVKAASEFIKMALTHDLQTEGIKQDAIIPVCKTALEDRFKVEIDLFNEESTFGSRLDYSLIDEYEAMVESASGCSSFDQAVVILICEDLQAYLAGDKSLDEVIPIMEDRCQTLLDQRG